MLGSCKAGPTTAREILTNALAGKKVSNETYI